MFKSIITPAVVTVLLAGSAFAASPSADNQLARSAGVEAGQYTAAELQNIIQARRDNDMSALNFYLSGANRTEVSNATLGTEQLARIAGVAPGNYTTTELLNIISAQRDGDVSALSFYLSGANRTGANPASAVTPGEAMLAASVGVDAANYTLSELIELQEEFVD